MWRFFTNSGQEKSTESISVPTDGWIEAIEAWTYAAADAPTFTFTAPGDLTAIYTPGTRIQLIQTTVKYFIVTKVAHAAGVTTITIYGGTDYVLANAVIAAPKFSRVKAPAGFPLNPRKWTVEVVDVNSPTVAAAVANTWYNLGSIQLSVPIGAWNLSYKCMAYADPAPLGNIEVNATLSTTNNSDTDMEFRSSFYPTQLVDVGITFMADKFVDLSTKTIYYLLEMTPLTSSPPIFLLGNRCWTRIRAVCAYL